jgi:hypothetical protein
MFRKDPPPPDANGEPFPSPCVDCSYFARHHGHPPRDRNNLALRVLQHEAHSPQEVTVNA